MVNVLSVLPALSILSATVVLPPAAVALPSTEPLVIRDRLQEMWRDLLKPPPQFPELADSFLYDRARSISVKVRSGSGWGTGAILARNGNTYLVVTNRHVLDTDDDTPSIETADGQVHAARERPDTRLDPFDLAILEFQSETTYPLAELGSSADLSAGTATISVGFPLQTQAADRADRQALNEDGFQFTEGEIALQLGRALEDGYQLAYTNAVEKGMSGGPVLNLAGEVIAINGIHADPLWGDPYFYSDGTRPEEAVRMLLRQSSLAIPIDTVVELLPDLTETADVERAASPTPTPEASTSETSTSETSTSETPTSETSTSEAPTAETSTPETQTPEASTPESQTAEESL